MKRENTTGTNQDKGRVKTVTQVLKFPNREAYEKALAIGLDKYLSGEVKDENVELVTIEGNCFLNEGINQGIWPLVCGASVTNYSNANARIGVGDGTTPESPTQTDLTGTNRLYKPCNAGYPVYGTDQRCTWQATFNENEANWAWQEWSISNTAGINLNRKQAYIGTKSGGVWVLTVSLTIT